MRFIPRFSNLSLTFTPKPLLNKEHAKINNNAWVIFAFLKKKKCLTKESALKRF